MNDDGSMARLPDLIKFAQFHGLRIGAIADLIAYRRRCDRIVEKIGEKVLHSRHGGVFRLSVYANKVAYAEHVALVKGDISRGGPPLVRRHAFIILDDVLGAVDDGKSGALQEAMELIEPEG